MANNLAKEKHFLLTNEDFFLNAASIRFAFTQKQLKKYKSILSWNYIVSNHKIKWNTNIIDEFKEDIFKSTDNFAEFHCNDSLPWSIDFIQRYEDLWDWSLLAQNSSAMDSLEIRNHFYSRLYPFIEDYSESCLGGSKSFGEKCLEILDRDLDFFKKHKELQFQNYDDILKTKTIDWRLLSQNTLLPWSVELIEKYVDKWDWSCLSTNESVPWDLKLIKTFENKIDWTIDTPNEDGSTTLTMSSISYNMDIEWDILTLSTFLHKLDKNAISLSESVKWDIDLIIQFNNFWCIYSLSLNKKIWSKVFHEFNKEEHLIPLLDIVLEKQKSK